MNRRSFFLKTLLSAVAAGATLDPERLLWRPGQRLISIPRPRLLWKQGFNDVWWRQRGTLMEVTLNGQPLGTLPKPWPFTSPMYHEFTMHASVSIESPAARETALLRQLGSMLTLNEDRYSITTWPEERVGERAGTLSIDVRRSQENA